MKVFIISFGTNPHIVAKFQTDRFRTFEENREEKNKEITPSKPYTLAAATLRSVRGRCQQGLFIVVRSTAAYNVTYFI